MITGTKWFTRSQWTSHYRFPIWINLWALALSIPRRRTRIRGHLQKGLQHRAWYRMLSGKFPQRREHLPNRMNSILQLHLFTTCLNEALYHIESTGFSWFEPLRIMENEMGVLSGNDFLVDIAYSMLVVGYGLYHIVIVKHGGRFLTAISTLKACLISDDFPTPDYPSFWSVRFSKERLYALLTLPTKRIRNL